MKSIKAVRTFKSNCFSFEYKPFYPYTKENYIIDLSGDWFGLQVSMYYYLLPCHYKAVCV